MSSAPWRAPAEARTKAQLRAARLLAMDRIPTLVVTGALVGWTAALVLIARDRYSNFRYARYDLGNMVQALCGETFPVTRAPKPGSPVCPDCKKIYEGLNAD